MRTKLAWVFLLATATAIAAEDRSTVIPRVPRDAEQQTARERAAIRPGKTYRPDVPTPESVLGYEIGSAHTDHRGVQAYLRALAAARPGRVVLRDYATSYEGRTLSYVLVSSEENVAALEKRRAAMGTIADPRGRSRDQVDAALRDARPIVWVGAAVHGDEHSSTEAVLALAYHLAACEDEDVKSLRDRTIVVLDPLQNPDGRERWIGFQRMLALSRTSGDRNGVEHADVWPSGRSNHYLFDMNRDFSFLTQPETRGRMRELVAWMPQVVIDLHEFSGESSYFFPPPNEPQNKNVPESLRKLFVEFGKANAVAFDERGYDYYVRDTFDFMYPGYGDMLPAMMGAVGMTFEQASPGGLVLKREDGQILTLTAATAHHFTASLATCRTAARLGPDLLRTYLDYRRTAVEEGASGEVKQFLLDATANPMGLRDLVDRLSLMGVEMRRLAGNAKIRTRDLVSGKDEVRDFAAGTVVVPLDQPQKRLVVSLLERDAEVDASFVLAERERFRARQPLRYYDLTAWSLPIAAGVRAYSSAVRSDAGSLEPLCADGSSALADCLRRNANATVPPARYGWLLRYQGGDAIRAAVALLDAGVVLRVAGKSFRLDDRTFERGTLLVRVNENAAKSDLTDLLTRVARENDLTVTPVDSSWTADGISLGSDDVARVRKPRIAVLWGEPAYSTSAGWIAWILDQRYGVPFTWVFPSTMTGRVLKEYDVVVLPDLRASTTELPLEALKTWVGNGGVLVAIGGAAEAIAKPGLKMTTVEMVEDLRKLKISLAEDGPASRTATGAREGAAATQPRKGKPSEPVPVDEGDEKKKGEQEDKEDKADQDKDEKEPIPREARPQDTPGSIFRVTLDPDSFLTFGYGSDLDVLVASSRVMTLSKEGYNVARYTEKPLVSGFAWQRMQRALAGRAYLVQENVGSGHLVLFAEDPNFRAGWEATERLFLNAVLFGPSQ